MIVTSSSGVGAGPAAQVHRIYVSSEERISGHRGDFVIDTSAEFARFEGRRVMCAVEWCDVVRYSSAADFSKNDENPSGLLLESPDIIASNSYETWSGNTSPILALLQNYGGAGVYGVAHDLPYCRKSHLGVLVDYDYIKRLGAMRFRLRRCHDEFSIGDLDLVSVIDNIEAFAFQLVFWEPCACTMFSPFSYDFYRCWVSSESAAGQQITDLRVPVQLNATRSVDTSEGKWMVALEYVTPITSSAATLPAAIAVLCPTLVGSEDRHVLGILGKSFREDEEATFGQRYSIKPGSRDVVGHELRVDVDRLSELRLQLADASTLQVLPDAVEYQPEYVCSIVFWRCTF
jgi:hypothetical protein